MVFSKPPSGFILAMEALESEGQHFKTEYTDRTKDGKEHDSDKAATAIDGQLSRKETGFHLDKRKGPQNNTKRREGIYNYSSATWGVALRKPSREKKKIKAYSPSREWTFRKKAKLGLDKGGKYGRNVVKKYKSRGGQVKQQEGAVSKENSIVAGNGDVSKCKTISGATTDKLTSDPKGHSDEFNNFMKAEIKRQLLNQLGEACKSAEIEAIEVEEIDQCTANGTHEFQDSVPLDRRYMATTKLKVTLLLPVTLGADEGAPQDFPTPMQVDTQPAARLESKVLDVYPDEGKEAQKAEFIEGVDDTKGPESTGTEAQKAEFIEGVDDTKGPESTGMLEDTREPEPRGLMEPDTREPEPVELMEQEKFHNQPQLESESSEEIEVPESEFYDFECERSVDKFSPGQVWASYDNKKDVMPRDYIRIEKVTSIDPFKLQITLLKPRGFSDWVKAGNALACGEFCGDNRLRGMDHIDGFSHIVNWNKGHNDMINIYPREREVWALYKDWKELDPNRRIKLGFEIVQIVGLQDDLTVSVIPLVKFKGSRTVFVQQLEAEPLKICKRDFIRFSHQIPTYKIIDMEGCMELDPAATPH